uniref:Tudor domain-containing protein n=1 Tax=Mola mola TaxID=94237 RepID=A0A3Q3WR78_MOLML
MSSVIGLPTRGSDITVLITKVHLHPLCVLVEFWGKFCQERTAAYESLSKDIQTPGNSFQEFEGEHGDQCLVQIDGTWYRCRIVLRNGSKYSVFLIDKGKTCSTTTSNLAWSKKKHFHLPAEVEYCVLANVLPLSSENRWSPLALEYLKSLSGKSAKAHVQDVLVPHRTFLLHVPCISKKMYEMGIARKLSPDMFQDFVLMSLQSQSGAQVSPGTQRISSGTEEQLHKQELFMYPELPAGTVETVIVTDVTNPHRIFCQLKVFSKELKKLSEQLTQCCEGRRTNCLVGPEMIGFPCAARGSDGRWYRSVLQQVFPTSKVVEVLSVDYGIKHFVQLENVRPLAAEFFRMPVVTYTCSLYGVIDKGVGWKNSQVDYLKTLLLYKTVIAKFEYQSISEGVHSVTLYGDENTNINNLFGSKEGCLLDCEKTLGDYAIQSTVYKCRQSAQQERHQAEMVTPGLVVEKKDGKRKVRLPFEDLSLGTSHVAIVQHVSDPSEFWIQTQNHAKEFNKLMDSIYQLYKNSKHKHVRNAVVGLYCAAKAEDGYFYRVTVAEVDDTQIKVFFVDYGNTEVVDRCNIHTLPDEFKNLPCLALKCTLAGIRPKYRAWSESAREFFIKAVTDKTLKVHVTAKFDDGYAVHLTNTEVGENDLSMLMYKAGLAERDETQGQPKAKMTTKPAVLAPTQQQDARPTHVYRNNEIFQTLNIVGLATNERKTPAFKEHMFPIGSVLDVTVSYIESPNDFWCQLVQNSGHLKFLMHNIQARYANSEFQPVLETACVARHPDNEMWYRALVIYKHKTPHVNVLFVDYGQTETVSLYDLRKIYPEFLILHGQAFRCSVLNPSNPTCATNEWNEEAIAKFHNFVETAVSNFVILKCTIYAVMYSEQKIVFNMVDLETPFENISTSMVNLVKGSPSKKGAGLSLRLDTYYYSTHNVKVGTEEQVTVTCVNHVGQFYCQLERNADVIKDLKIKVNSLCHQLENVNVPTLFGTLCFAKYSDDQWYRGQIKATNPAILVHFVDYGDTIEVQRSDLLPVPREANDIMSVPVQAILCSLSDVSVKVPSEVNSWFEKFVTEYTFRALVVARESDGKLLVELYHGKTQINSKLKRIFQIEMYAEDQVVYQAQRAHDSSANQKTPKAVPKQTTEINYHTQIIKKDVSTAKPACQVKDVDKTLQSAPPKPLCHVGENGQKVRTASLGLYKPPHQRQLCERIPSAVGIGLNKAKASLPTETKQLKSSLPDLECQKKSETEQLPKLEELPSKSIISGMEADVYVSHCNNPLSFYVQVVREEDEIISLVEKLNDPHCTSQTDKVKDVHPGDLVKAEFENDSSWYRAVVREIHPNITALVEYVDFGNTATIPISKIGRLDKYFLQLPIYSTHCMLRDAAALEKGGLDPKVVTAFKEDIGGNEVKILKCQFIRQSGSVWIVSLEDSDLNVTCVPTKCSNTGFEIASEQNVEEPLAQTHDIRQVSETSQKSLLNSSFLSYHQQEFIAGQKLDVCITTINDSRMFWCQPVDSEDLVKITSGVLEICHAVNQKPVGPGSFSPGSPCIALFSGDGLWYRAEIIEDNGEELFVLFVDYGNTSKVSVTDVREMPTDLMDRPIQAFLCELEGFDASHGSWDSGAADKLLALTLDKVLELTVARVSREDGKIKCFVQMKCEGQVINEVLKNWWKSFTSENKPGAFEPTIVFETSLQSVLIVKETAPPVERIKYPERQENVTAVTQRCHSEEEEEESIDELVEPQAAEEVQKLASSLKHSKTSGDWLPPESSMESPEKQRHQILSEYNMTNEPKTLRLTENLRQHVVPSTVVCQIKPKDILPCDGDADPTIPPVDDKDEPDILSTSCASLECSESTEEEERDALAMNTLGPDALNSISDGSDSLSENPVEAIEESKVGVTDLKSLPAEVNTYSIDNMHFSDCDTTCSEILIDASTEQEVEGGDDVPEKQGLAKHHRQGLYYMRPSIQ